MECDLRPYVPCRVRLGPWGPVCSEGRFAVKICTCKPRPCPPPPPIYCVPRPIPCPPPCVPCPPTCGVYEQLIPKPSLPCPPPCPPRYLDFGHPPVPPCPAPCPPPCPPPCLPSCLPCCPRPVCPPC